MKLLHLAVAAVSIFFFLISCTEDKPTEPDNTADVIASESIGGEGGELSDETITLTIPAGCFQVASELSLTEETLDNEQNVVTAVYGVDGIPLANNAPIQIELKTEQVPTENTNIVIMHDEFVKSTGKVRQVSQILPTNYEDGVLKAEIPAGSGGLLKSSAVNDEGKYKVSLFGQVTGYKLLSSGNHFELHVPVSMTDDAQRIAGFFEDAYTRVKNLGFNFSKRTEWPVLVYIKPLSDDGGFVSGKWSVNSSFIELNENLFTKSEEEFKVTVGHEFFHLIQDLYDPRGIASKLADNTRNKATGYLPRTVWLDEAMSTWFEEKFSNTQNYVSPNVDNNKYQPYYGPEGGFVLDAPNHGYGMASVIKYLVKKHGEQILVPIYDKIKTGSNPFDAVQSPIESPLVLWWSDYIKDYTLNEVYADVHSANYIKNAFDNTSTYKIDELSNTTKQFEDSFSDLATRFYYLDLNYSSEDKNASISCSHGVSHLTLFKISGFNLIYQDFSSDGSYEIKNLNSFRDANSDLLLMVTDYMGNSPYDKSHNIPLELTITTEDKPQYDLSIYDEMVLAVNCRATRTNSAGDSDVNYEYPGTWALLKIENFGGSFTGNTFTVDFTERYGSSNADIQEASATAEVDMANSVVKNISINLKYTNANDEYNTFEQQIEISELPFIEQYNYMKFGYYGTDGGSAITSFKDYEVDGNFFVEYKDLKFDSNSYIVLLFRQR